MTDTPTTGSPEPAPPTDDGASRPSPFPAVRPVHFSDPPRWLAAGWDDLRTHPRISLFFGACFVVAGASLWWTFLNNPAYLLALCGSFLLLGPFLCLGMYDVSRRRERGLQPTLASALSAWRTNFKGLGVTCTLLLVLEMLWSRSALVIFAVAFNTVPEAQSTLEMLVHPSNYGFLAAYFVVGCIFALLIFATTVVALPMLIDRNTDSIVAGITSFRATLSFPGPMLFWGLLIVLIVAISAVPLLLGIFISAPLLGHASWHAYRHIVEPPDEASGIKP